jgi:hypothetical protein
VSVRGMKSKLAKIIDSARQRCGTRLVFARTADEPEPPPCPRGAACKCKRVVIVEVIVNTPEEARAVQERNAETR